LPAIRERIDNIPVVGVIEPGAQAACAASRSGHIAVIATEGTVRGGAYQEAILRFRENARVAARAAQLFVALAEEGLHEGPIAENVARHYLEPLFGAVGEAISSRSEDAPLAGKSRPDTLVLGCTHFPMLVGAIRAAVGPNVCIVDSAATTARSVHDLLVAQSLALGMGEGHLRFLATDSPERFARIGSRFLERRIRSEEVELIDL
jgi:glutamate racemase